MYQLKLNESAASDISWKQRIFVCLSRHAPWIKRCQRKITQLLLLLLLLMVVVVVNMRMLNMFPFEVGCNAKMRTRCARHTLNGKHAGGARGYVFIGKILTNLLSDCCVATIQSGVARDLRAPAEWKSEGGKKQQTRTVRTFELNRAPSHPVRNYDTLIKIFALGGSAPCALHCAILFVCNNYISLDAHWACRLSKQTTDFCSRFYFHQKIKKSKKQNF